MLFVVEDGVRKSVPASAVSVGDTLVTEFGDTTAVVRIKSAKARGGVYAPFTTSGTIVLSGIVASNYVAMQDSDFLVVAGIKTPFSFQWLAHTFQLPHRLMCNFFWSECKAETYTNEGVSSYVDVGLQLALWYVNQNAMCAGLVFGFVILPLLAILSVLDIVVSNPVSFTVTVVGIVVARKHVSVNRVGKA